MDNKRHGLRAKCNDKCVLVLNGSEYGCLLEDISIFGAQIKISENLGRIRVGIRCGLHLCGDPSQCPVEYSCQIARISPTEIGLKFIR